MTRPREGAIVQPTERNPEGPRRHAAPVGRLRIWGRLVAFTSLGFVIFGFLTSLQRAAGINLIPGRAPMSIGHSMAYILPQWLPWALAAPFVIWLTRRFRFVAGVRGRALLVHLAVALSLASLNSMLAVAAYKVLIPERRSAFVTDLLAELNTRMAQHLIVYLFVLALAHTADSYQRLHERTLLSVRLETQLSKARLRALEMQLRPHFLFNSLNSAAVLIPRDPRAGVRTLTRLGNLLHRTMAREGVATVELADELDLLQQYLELECQRFSDRLEYSVEVPPRLLRASVPSLGLLPLVENAIVHGVARTEFRCLVVIRAQLRSDHLRLMVVNTRAPGTPDPEKWVDGVGLRVVRERLQIQYGNDACLVTEADDFEVRVAIDCPHECSEVPVADMVRDYSHG